MFSKANIVLSAILSLVVATHAAPSTNAPGPAFIYCKSPDPTIKHLTNSKSSLKGGTDGYCMDPGIPVNRLAELMLNFQAPTT